MIVCHCNVIHCDKVRDAVRRALHELPAQAITPAHIYDRCGAIPNCGGCGLLIRRLIAIVAEEEAALAEAAEPQAPRRKTA